METVARGVRSGISEQTRARLVAAAEQLFAERGLDGVSLAEINRTAGQKNATALHYHFGGKEGLIQAIFDKHTPRVNALREKMLARLPARPELDQLAAVLVIPLAEQVRDTDGGACYLQFLAQMMNNPRVPDGGLDQADSPILQQQAKLFRLALVHLPEAERTLRVRLMVLMVFNGLARYAAQLQSPELDQAAHQLLVNQLVLAATAVLAADEQLLSERRL